MDEKTKQAIIYLLESLHFDETDLAYYPDAGFDDAIENLRSLLD